MMGVQLSVGWAVAQAAESLAASQQREKRNAGRALRCCEAVRLDKVGEAERERGTQGVRVALRFYRDEDRATVKEHDTAVAAGIARAMGLWSGAVQLDLGLLADDGSWLGVHRPYQRGGTGLRLDRYLLKPEVIEELSTKQGQAVWLRLAQSPGQARILLRRLRYRFGEDYGAPERNPSYAYWTTDVTRRWSEQFWNCNRQRCQEASKILNYLVSDLSSLPSSDLEGGNADLAASLDPGYWGEVDTEKDPLHVGQLTTRTGATKDDVRAVLKRGGSQVKPHCATISRTSDPADPTAFFIGELTDLLEKPERMRPLDVLLVHRGGGIEPVTPGQKKELLGLCRNVREHGVEVVVALGHADLSVLQSPDEDAADLPLGVFETTTPTAGAAWILAEHINPRLVDTSLIYSQPPTA